MIPGFAYHIKNGPWRRLWVKYGVDPRADPNYSKYQIVDFRVPLELQSQFDSHKENLQKPYRNQKLNSLDEYMHKPSKINETHFIFDCVPDKLQNYYQLCDVALKPVQNMIQHKEEKISDSCGYYTQETFSNIRKIMKVKVESWMKGLNPKNDSDVIYVQRNYRKEESNLSLLSNPLDEEFDEDEDEEDYEEDDQMEE
jgi:general transcription factor 3C polypeptide 5 (transcription factor C subunit 1)